MLRKIVSLILAMVLLTGCSAPAESQQKKQYTATFLTLFDTVTTIIGYAESEEAFENVTNNIRDELEVYHQLFDIYNDYEGVANIKTINDQAGIAPVSVDPIIIDFLLDCKEYYELTGGMVNVAMGSVLYLWHEERDAGINNPGSGKLPKAEALEEAAKHCSFDTIIIDEEASTVYIEDPDQRLDVGAIAKGWASQKVAENAPAGLLISVGGNVCATGVKKTDSAPWVIGIQDPDDANGNLHTVYVSNQSVVTSGDYQRSYRVEGKSYHHIIDPATLMPSEGFLSVSIVCQSSADGDALSTALFCMTLEQGMALIESLPDTEAMWVLEDGTKKTSSGFESYTVKE